jgi:hypothetical protein
MPSSPVGSPSAATAAAPRAPSSRASRPLVRRASSPTSRTNGDGSASAAGCGVSNSTGRAVARAYSAAGPLCAGSMPPTTTAAPSAASSPSARRTDSAPSPPSRLTRRAFDPGMPRPKAMPAMTSALRRRMAAVRSETRRPTVPASTRPLRVSTARRATASPCAPSSDW